MRDKGPLRAVHCVCFDLGGVLVKIARSFAEGCQAAGLELRGASAGTTAGRLRGQLSARFGLGQIAEADYYEQASQLSAGLYTAEEMERIHSAWSQPEYPGARALVDDLNARGIATACLSNTNEAHWRRLRHSASGTPQDGEPEYPAVLAIQHALASHLLALAKPDVEIYRAFERVTGFSGSEILFFDDLPANVSTARTLGWRAEHVEPSADTIGQMRALLARHGLAQSNAKGSS